MKTQRIKKIEHRLRSENEVVNHALDKEDETIRKLNDLINAHEALERRVKKIESEACLRAGWCEIHQVVHPFPKPLPSQWCKCKEPSGGAWIWDEMPQPFQRCLNCYKPIKNEPLQPPAYCECKEPKPVIEGTSAKCWRICFSCNKPLRPQEYCECKKIKEMYQFQNGDIFCATCRKNIKPLKDTGIREKVMDILDKGIPIVKDGKRFTTISKLADAILAIMKEKI